MTLLFMERRISFYIKYLIFNINITLVCLWLDEKGILTSLLFFTTWLKVNDLFDNVISSESEFN